MVSYRQREKSNASQPQQHHLNIVHEKIGQGLKRHLATKLNQILSCQLMVELSMSKLQSMLL